MAATRSAGALKPGGRRTDPTGMDQGLGAPAPTAAPTAGWYPDPGGSGGHRWWDGVGWTESVRLPATPVGPDRFPPAPAQPLVPPPVAAQPAPAPPAAPRAAPVTPTPVASAAVAPVSQFAGDARFGPVDPAAVAAAAATQQPGGFGSPGVPATHRAGPARPSGSPRPTGRMVVVAVGVVVLLATAVLIGKSVLGGSGQATDGSAGLSGLTTPGNPQVAAMRADVLSISTAEESTFTDTQAYAAAAGAGGSVQVGTSPVRLSAAGENVTVVLSPSHLAYCIRATRTPAGGGAPQVVVYVSSTGGMQPAIVTICPASF